ncbi:MAG TPA: SsrA-binding protein SmpB [Candidatus Saccharimonadales bacterium]|nr:SsrA-binding protein SmpB [Candidatus Saccharimonadales bacterium]
MKKPAKSQTKRISNRRARHDYELGDGLIVGVQLTGPETKALRLGHGQLRGAYVTVKDSELWLINATISGGPGLPISETEQTRSRKLLAKRREIDHLIAAKQQGQSIIPLEMLTGGHFIKLRIAVGRGKKQYDKRQTLKRREEQKRINQAVKNHR